MLAIVIDGFSNGEGGIDFSNDAFANIGRPAARAADGNMFLASRFGVSSQNYKVYVGPDYDLDGDADGYSAGGGPSVSPGHASFNGGNEYDPGVSWQAFVGGGDRRDGSADADTLEGGKGNDLLFGLGQDDLLDGGAGADTMHGGSGDDIYIVDDPGDVVVEAPDEGDDLVLTGLSAYVLTDNVERLTYTGTGAATLTGNALDNILIGDLAGDLFFLQHGGADRAEGGDGSDGFFFGAALDALDEVVGGTGLDDQLALQGTYNSYWFSGTNLNGIETLALLSGSNTQFGAPGTARHNYIFGFNDAALAAGQRLTINGNGLLANEQLYISGSQETNGSFIIYGGLGSNTMTGGQQNDAFYFGHGRFKVTDRVHGGGGADDQLALAGNYGTQLVFTATTMVNVDTIALLTGGSTSFSYNLKTHDSNLAAGAQLSVNGGGLAANEVLSFDGSAETNGFFRFIGGAGSDSLVGGAGDDLFFGGLGGDNLTGNGGADRFIYTATNQSTAAAADTVLDFAAGDKIDLSAIDAVVGGGNDAFTFIGSGAFTAAGQVRVTHNSVIWVMEANVDADLGADMVIGGIVSNSYVPVAGDFIL